MRLEHTFQRWRAASNCPDIAWDQEISLQDRDAFYLILQNIFREQNHTQQNGWEDLELVSTAIIEDILEHRLPPNPYNSTDLKYLQFETTCCPIAIAVFKNGDMGSAHDWIANGLSDQASNEVLRETEGGRLQEFLHSEVPWIVDNRHHTLADWSKAFYYYCRRRATYYELAEQVLPAALAALQELPTEISIDPLCMITSWAVVYDRAETPDLVRLLQNIFSSQELAEQLKVKIAVLFATQAGNRTDKTPRAWAEWALHNGRSYLRSHEPLQLLLTLVETPEDWERHEQEIVAAVRTYTADLRNLQSPVEKAQARDLRFGLMNPAFVTLHRLGNANAFFSLLQHWYGVQAERRQIGGALFISPNHAEGLAVLGETSELVPLGEERGPEELTRATGAALGLPLSFEGDPRQPELPDRPAQPNYDEAENFENMLQNVYRFDQIPGATFLNRTAMMVIPGYPHPVQALMAVSRGDDILPISSSLQAPEPDRELRRVLLWDTQEDLYSTFEIDAVEELFGASGIECVRQFGNNCTLDRFYAEFSNPEYDLIWIAGHGEIDHWRDGSSTLSLGNGVSVNIDQLIAGAPSTNGRRLLMLNVCDGGVSALNGGIHHLGIAPMLANAGQATISHHWPVHPLTAAAFGTFLAAELAQGHAFFTAYASALAKLREPFDEIAESIRVLVPERELVERLSNVELENNVFHWGSACFFQ